MKSRRRKWLSGSCSYLWVGFSCFVVTTLFATGTADAQSARSQLPNPNYYNSAVFQQYYSADYSDAFKNFKRGHNGAYKLGTRRYLDSVCYLTMMGECNYHTGNYALAVGYYEDALRLYLSYQAESWQARVQVPQGIVADNNAYTNARITWGLTRKAKTARVPQTFAVLFGRLDAERAFQEGGVAQSAELNKINVTEIMRCTALCLHRRRTIKGPTCKFDPLSGSLVTGLASSNAGNGSVMGAYNGVLLGIAQASQEDYQRANSTLERSLQIQGMDHALTPVALVELARIRGATGNYTAAGQVALQASNAAAVYEQYDLVEESLSFATTMHLMTAKTPFAPLPNAIVWAKLKKARLMQVSLIQKLAECLAEGGDSSKAAAVLKQANGVISSRNSLGSSVAAARLKYVGALVRFLNGDFAKGRVELNLALKHFQTGSLWLYRLGLVESLVTRASLSQREADRLYTVLLRDPTDLDWKTDPFESLAFLASNHVIPMERWFNIIIDRKDTRRAIEVAELLKRHRFFSSLPLGGRLMAFRWVLHAPEESLTPTAIAQKQKFLATNPRYQKLANQSQQINTALGLLPLKPEPRSDEGREQLKLMRELAGVSDVQEAILASYALRREPSEMAFPPQRSITDFQKQIGEKQIALYTMATATGYHLFFIKKNAIQYLDPVGGRQMLRGVGGLLKEMGISVAALDVKNLQETKWKESVEGMKQALFGTVKDKDWKTYDEFVIIPDGVLWYVPFEAIPVTDDAGEEFLSDWLHIRYSPTLFLAFGKQRPQEEAVKRTAVVTARMSPRGEGTLSSTEYQDFTIKNPDAVQFERPSQVPASYLVSVIDQLVVWSDIKSTKGFPMAMNPFQIDFNKPGSKLESWISLPWAGPKHVVIPGLNSDAGTGLRNKAFGQDLFLTSVGLMASGSRSALLSRWSTGGKSAIELTKMYATELPNSGPRKAILDSRQELRKMKLDYNNEPKVRFKKTDPVLKAEHPFFWAAHMLFEIPDGKPVVPVLGPDPNAVDPDIANPGNANPDNAVVDPKKPAMKPEDENPDGVGDIGDKADPNKKPEKEADPDAPILPGKESTKEGKKGG